MAPVLRLLLAEQLEMIRSIDRSYQPDPDALSTDESKDYHDRNTAVIGALNTAMILGYRCGMRASLDDLEWPCVYIELPEVGQVSWHIPAYPGKFDGHTVPEKYDRIRRAMRTLGDLGEMPDGDGD